MKVKELKELLNELNDEDLVVVSLDDQGNKYSPIEDYYECIYVEDTDSWFGNTYIRQKELTTELIEYGFTEEDIYNGDNGINAVILYPELK